MKRALTCLVLTLAFASRAAAQEGPGPSEPPAPQVDAPLPRKPETTPPRTAVPQAAPTQAAPDAGQVAATSSAAAPLGLVLSADLGGGGTLGGGSEFTPRGVFEAELSAGYELPAGFRPELSVLLGVAPRSNAGLRLGLHYSLPDVPFYVRFAIDGSTVRGPARWRWLLAGVGGEVRLTDVLGGFAEADLGLPLTSGSGVPVLVRAGIAFRL